MWNGWIPDKRCVCVCVCMCLCVLCMCVYVYVSVTSKRPGDAYRLRLVVPFYVEWPGCMEAMDPRQEVCAWVCVYVCACVCECDIKKT